MTDKFQNTCTEVIAENSINDVTSVAQDSVLSKTLGITESITESYTAKGFDHLLINAICKILKKGGASKLKSWYNRLVFNGLISGKVRKEYYSGTIPSKDGQTKPITRLIKGRNNGYSFTQEIQETSEIKLEPETETENNASDNESLDVEANDQRSILRRKHEAEYAGSAIHPDLFENFITHESNRDILNALLVGEIERTNTGRASLSYLNLYGGMNSGWEVGTLGCDFIQFKPDEQYRRVDGEGKPIKYENPPKLPSDIFRLKYIPTWLARQLGCDVESQQFWEWVNRGCRSLWITEGAKKAASLLSWGKVAVGLTGINNLYNRINENTKRAIPALVEITRNKDEITIAFDAPEKLSQITPLIAAYHNLKQFIQNQNPKCKINIAVWDWHLGKGIDDVIAAGHFDKVSVLPYYEALRFINSNIPASKRIVGKQYLSLEDVDYVHPKFIAIKAPKNSGKTFIVSQFLKNLLDEQKVLNITHRIKLGKGQAKRFGLYYITDDVSKKEGDAACKRFKISLCINSLHKQKGIDAEYWKGAVIILDEVVQLWNHIVNSGTLKKAPEILNNFREILRNAHQIVLMDADLDFKTLKIIDEIMGEDCGFLKQLKVYEFEKKADKIPMKVYKCSNKNVGVRTYNAIMTNLLDGKRVLSYVDSQKTDSKLGAETLVQSAKKEYFRKTGKQLKAIALYSRSTKNAEHDASKIANNINLLYEYDLVVYTTVIGTGVSLELEITETENECCSPYCLLPHFDVVIGGFVGAISIDDILQGLYRYRIPVPRIVFVPNKGKQFKTDGSQYSVKENRYHLDKIKANVLALYPLLADEIPESDAINEPIRNYHARSRAIGRLESDNFYRFFIEKASEDYEVISNETKVKTETPAVLEETIEEQLVIESERINPLNVVNDEKYEELKAKESLPKKEFNEHESTKLAKKYKLEEFQTLVNPELYLTDIKEHNYLSGIRMHYFMNSYDNALLDGEIKLKQLAFDTEKYTEITTKSVEIMIALGAGKLRQTEGEVLHRCHPTTLEIINNYYTLEKNERGVVRRHLHIDLDPQKPMLFIESLGRKQGMKPKSLGKKKLPNGERINQIAFSIPDETRYKIFEAWDEHYNFRRILNEHSKIRIEKEKLHGKEFELKTEMGKKEAALLEQLKGKDLDAQVPIWERMYEMEVDINAKQTNIDTRLKTLDEQSSDLNKQSEVLNQIREDRQRSYKEQLQKLHNEDFANQVKMTPEELADWNTFVAVF